LTFSIGIVAHESRITQAKQLYDTVSADVLMVDDANLRLGAERNHIRTWQSLCADFPTAQWLCILEDDAEPVPDFLTQLTAALSVAPAPFVSLYLGRGFPRQWQPRYRETVEAATPDTCWATTSGWMMHAVGIAVRTELVPAMLKHLDQMIGHPVDQSIGQHARNIREKVAYTLPSLVDHADGPTIHTHQDGQPRTPGRKAWVVGSRDEWNSKTIEMG
jgi:hypothetical protein